MIRDPEIQQQTTWRAAIEAKLADVVDVEGGRSEPASMEACQVKCRSPQSLTSREGLARAPDSDDL